MDKLLRRAKNTEKLKTGKVFMLTFEDPELQALVIGLNQQQLQLGKLANDTFLPQYSFTSISKYGKRPGPWTLYDTGYFYSSMTVIGVTETEIIEWGDSEKPTRDLAELGPILGLSQEFMEMLAEEAIPFMRKEMLEEMMKGI